MLPALRSGWVKRSRIHMRSAFFSLPGGIEVRRRKTLLQIVGSQVLVDPKTPTLPSGRLDNHLLPTSRGRFVELVVEKPLAPQMVLQ